MGHTSHTIQPNNDEYHLGIRYDNTILLNLTKNIQLFQFLQYFFETTKIYKDVQNYKYNILYLTTNEWVGPYILQLGKRFLINYHTNRWHPGTISNWKHNSYSSLILTTNTTEITVMPDIIILLDRDIKNNIRQELYGLDCWLFSLCDSNIRPYEVTHPIISNDDSLFSIYFWTVIVTTILLSFGLIRSFIPKLNIDDVSNSIK
jgi:ribosomal protein S2